MLTDRMLRMSRRRRIALFISFSLGLTLRAAPPRKGGIEIWLFEGPKPIADVNQVLHPGDATYPGSPFSAEVRGRTDRYHIAGMRIDNGAMQIGLIDVTVSANLRVKNRTVIDILGKRIDKTIVLADLPNCGIHLWLKHPLTISMPTSFDLRWIQQGPGARLEISDAGRAALRAHFEAQIDQLLSDRSFDSQFGRSTFNLSGPAEAAFNLFFNAKKGDLLAGLRNHLKSEIDRDQYFDRFLVGLDHGLATRSMGADEIVPLTMDRSPAPAVGGTTVALPANTWVVREQGSTLPFSRAVLTAVPTTSASRPAASLLIGVGRLNGLLRDYLRHLGENSGAALSAANLQTDGSTLTYKPNTIEAEQLAALYASVGSPISAPVGKVISLPLTGPSAPIIQPWYVPGNISRQYIDLWVSLDCLDSVTPASPAASAPRLGLLFVFSLDNKGKLSLVQLLPYQPSNHAVGPAVNLREQNNFTGNFANQLALIFARTWINARLGESGQADRLPVRGIRLLGERSQRAPGEKLAEALAIDLELGPGH